MRNYLVIGSAPANEECAQVGSEHYHNRAMKECGFFIKEFRLALGPEPPLAHLEVRLFDHDFGSYYEVVCYYDKDDQEAYGYALQCEDKAPTKWTGHTLKEVIELGRNGR